MTYYKNAVMGMAIVMILLGLGLVVRTLPHFGVGVILGVLFIAAGVGRLLMLRRRS